MKKAVIAVGGGQHLVSEGDTIEVNYLKDAKKTVEFSALLTVDDAKIVVGKPEVPTVKVTAEVIDPLIKADKVTSIRYKSKKRVKKVRGHRQSQTRLKIKKIS